MSKKKFERFDKNLQKQLLKEKKKVKFLNQMLVDCSLVMTKHETLLKRKNEEIEMLRERLKIPFRLVEKHDVKRIWS